MALISASGEDARAATLNALDGNLNREITVTKDMLQVEGTSIGIKAGDKIKLENLLYGLLLESGNDAANAIAISLAGSLNSFANMMNKRASQIGMKNTNFVTPSGLDDENHYSTAYDMALLASEAMKNETFCKIVATKQFKSTYNDGDISVTYSNHNRLLDMYDGVDGIKTGFTKKSGRCLVSSCVNNGVRLIAVTLNAPDDWNDHIQMLNSGFREFSVRHIISKGQCLGFAQINGGLEQTVSLLAAEDFSYAIAEHEQLRIVFPGPGFAYAPVDRGQDAGFAHLCLGDESIYKMPLVYGETVELAPQPKRSFWEKLWKLKKNVYFCSTNNLLA